MQRDSAPLIVSVNDLGMACPKLVRTGQTQGLLLSIEGQEQMMSFAGIVLPCNNHGFPNGTLSTGHPSRQWFFLKELRKAWNALNSRPTHSSVFHLICSERSFAEERSMKQRVFCGLLAGNLASPKVQNQMTCSNHSNGLTIPRATVAQLSNCPSNMHHQEISCSSPTQPFRTNVWSSKPLRPLGGRSFHELSERSGCTTS